MNPGSGRGPGPVAGADGGGTALRLLIVDADGREIGRREGPPSLVTRGGAPGVARGIALQLRGLASQSGVDLPLAAFSAGLAGAGRRPLAAEVEAELRAAKVARWVEVVSDAVVALEDAFPEGPPVSPGILLVSGTGSIALARTPGGGMVRVGGWGPTLGDEGSGFRLGLGGIQAVVRDLEGRGPATRLTPVLLRELGRQDPEGVFGWLDQAEKGEVAALAPLVLATTGEGLEREGPGHGPHDPVADGLASDAVDALAAHVSALLPHVKGLASDRSTTDRISQPRQSVPRSAAGSERRGEEGAGPGGGVGPVTVGLHGGLIARGGPLRLRLEPALERLGVHLLRADIDAVSGAARRARKAAARSHG